MLASSFLPQHCCARRPKRVLSPAGSCRARSDRFSSGGRVAAIRRPFHESHVLLDQLCEGFFPSMSGEEVFWQKRFMNASKAISTGQCKLFFGSNSATPPAHPSSESPTQKRSVFAGHFIAASVPRAAASPRNIAVVLNESQSIFFGRFRAAEMFPRLTIFLQPGISTGHTVGLFLPLRGFCRNASFSASISSSLSSSESNEHSVHSAARHAASPSSPGFHLVSPESSIHLLRGLAYDEEKLRQVIGSLSPKIRRRIIRVLFEQIESEAERPWLPSGQKPSTAGLGGATAKVSTKMASDGMQSSAELSRAKGIDGAENETAAATLSTSQLPSSSFFLRKSPSADEIFDALDLNRDGQVTQREFRTWYHLHFKPSHLSRSSSQQLPSQQQSLYGHSPENSREKPARKEESEEVSSTTSTGQVSICSERASSCTSAEVCDEAPKLPRVSSSDLEVFESGKKEAAVSLTSPAFSSDLLGAATQLSEHRTSPRRVAKSASYFEGSGVSPLPMSRSHQERDESPFAGDVSSCNDERRQQHFSARTESCLSPEFPAVGRSANIPYLADPQSLQTADLFPTPRSNIDVSHQPKPLSSFDLEEEDEATSPTRKQLCLVVLRSSIPYIGFGFMDNCLMLLFGDMIDQHLGVALNLSTLAAASFGNLLSCASGVVTGGFVERFVYRQKWLPRANLTTGQADSKLAKNAHLVGSVLGICIGCIVGMLPLLSLPRGTRRPASLPDTEHQDKAHDDGRAVDK